jgi:Concanavalin A-like lectin/glucanases superfamily
MGRVGLLFVILAMIHVPVLPVRAEPERSFEMGRVGTRVRFDFADGELSDADNRLVLDPLYTGDGYLKQIQRGEGWAIQFPPVCRDTPEFCPRAILEAAPDVTWLNPGSRPVRWGASVLLAADMTSEGSNVLQKGLSIAGTQFKLQIDGEAGRPSCVMAGPVEGENRIFVAVAPAGIADGGWHSLVCDRLPASLSLVIDGAVVARVDVPPGLSIANDLPLRLGGKGVGPYNDQFHGVLDDVFVEIG